ncbi:MAG: flagellar basal body L-ring protein FlgH [Pseudomonadota bacterium]
MKRLSCIFLILLVSGCMYLPKAPDESFHPAMPVVKTPKGTNAGAIYQAGYDVPFLTDIKARNVGDLVTIQLVEQTNASKSSSTSTSKETDIENTAPTVLGRAVTDDGIPILNQTINGAHEFSGAADSSQSNSLTGSVTVTVVERLSNGNLLVRGEKWVGINQGREFVQLSGIIRSTDINPDNTITSDKVANARINYGGRGNLNDANKMGLLARFFNSPWMPF